MTLRTKKWDGAEHIDSDEDARTLLEEIARDATVAELAHGIDVVARARGMTAIARELGIPRARLFELVNPYNEEFEGKALREIVERLISVRPADAAE